MDSGEAGSRKAGILPSNYSHCSYVPSGIIHDETDSSADVSQGYYIPVHMFLATLLVTRNCRAGVLDKYYS